MSHFKSQEIVVVLQVSGWLVDHLHDATLMPRVDPNRGLS